MRRGVMRETSFLRLRFRLAVSVAVSWARAERGQLDY